MAIQYRDGSFSETMPIAEALEKFIEEIDNVQALHVGTENEIAHVKKRKELGEQVAELSKRLDKLETKPVQSDKIIIPTKDEMIQVLGNRIGDCGCRLENTYSNTVLLCEECSKLKCHNIG